jgi:membrane dipeptidase
MTASELVDELERGHRVHDQSTVLLAHLHMERRLTPNTIDYDRPDEDVPGRQVDLPKLRAGGVNIVWLSDGVAGEFRVDPEAHWRGTTEANHRPATRTVFRGSSEIHRMIRSFDSIRRLCADEADQVGMATTVQEALNIVESGRIAVFLHTELLLLANDFAALRAYHAMGLRCSGLVHATVLDWIDSDREQRVPGGLTDFGEAVIREMNRLGIVIDISHASSKAIDDVLRVSRHPIVASHSNAKAHSAIQRNLSDAHITAIAAGGGVIGIHASSKFVDIKYVYTRIANGPKPFDPNNNRLDLIGKADVPGALDPFALEANGKGGVEMEAERGDLARLLDHVDHIANIAGIDHVGIGSDFQMLEDPIDGWSDVTETPNITAGLLKRGYSESDVAKVLGGNFLRVMRDVIGE